MTNPAIWNKEEILNQLSGDEIFLKELVGDLLTLLEESKVRLASALKAGDWKTVSMVAHTLKGSSGNLSAHEIYQIAQTLEVDCKNGGVRASDIYENLLFAFDRLREELISQGYFPTPTKD